MRRLFCAIIAVCFSTLAFGSVDEQDENPYDPLAAVPAPLREAVKKVGRDTGRWAYTVQTVERDRKGEVVGETIARFDPSQHYDVQWTLLKKNGKDATEAQIRSHRKERARLAKRRKPFGELLDLERAELVDDASVEPGVLTYRVPLKPGENGRIPVDKVEVLVRVHQETQAFASIQLKLLDSVRAAVVAKLKKGGALLEFSEVNPEFAPTLTRITFDLNASIAFIPVQQHTTQTRSDFKRVTPYDDRFEVKLGPLQTIDF